MFKKRAFFLYILIFALSCVSLYATADEKDQARRILERSGVRGGVIVHIGCGDGKLTAALHANESFLVQGLDRNAENVEKAREYIRSLGIYGPVSVDRWDGTRLPYADNLVNLVVAGPAHEISREEIMRVLAPGGVAVFLNRKSGIEGRKLVKPRPKDIDEWTHYLHDASGNPVARDRVVGPPRRVQWIAKPRHARSHEYTPSIFALVSTGGRIFYVADLGPTSSIQAPAQWHLIARDAFNGVMLWKRPIPTWFPHLCGWTQGPPQLQRRLVAVGDRVYVTLGFHAPVSVVDAATGKTLKVYDQTRGAEEILWHKGILLLAVRSVTDERIAELRKWMELEKEKESPLRERESREVLVKQFRAIEGSAERAIMALDADTGRLLWKKAGTDVAGLRPLSLCAAGNRVFYQRRKNITCLDLKTGKELWSAVSTRMRLACESCVVCADNRTITALWADTGKVLWSEEALLCMIRDVFVINGSLWVGGFKPWTGEKKKRRGPAWGSYYVTQRDLATGKVLKHLEPENPGHHHRCWTNKATERYIIAGRRGAEFIDVRTGDVLWHNWVRGVCRYGVMPCNGLLYAPPHACGCYIAAKLDGFYALAAERGSGPAARGPDEGRLERGPAYSRIRSPQSAIRNRGEWPTYRHDAGRSGYTKSSVPAKLKPVWQAELGGRLSSVVVAGGRLYVASVDDHTVHALDVRSGKPLWSFTAGGRVDSPPTIYKGRVLFGSADGWVYCLRADDGEPAWRLRAARNERRITAWGQLESVSPVPGSVLVRDGVAYVTAGRSSYLDGGIDLYRVQPETGKILSRTPIYSPDPKTGRQPKQYGPCYMPGALADILTSDGQHVYLRDMVFDMQGGGQTEGNPHLLTLTGFLDDTWPHRSYWIFGTRCSLSTGCSGREKKLIYGRLLVFDGSTIYGYGRANVDWSNQLRDRPYRLFARNRGEQTEQWTKHVPIQVRAMVLADKVLFAAGPPADAGNAAAEPDERQGARLMAISASDGAELAGYPLDSSPVFDGMAAADGRLYISTLDGRVLCMGSKK